VRRSHMIDAQAPTVVSLETAITPGLITSRTETLERAIITLSGGSATRCESSQPRRPPAEDRIAFRHGVAQR
jgi:hypothetical protein